MPQTPHDAQGPTASRGGLLLRLHSLGLGLGRQLRLVGLAFQALRARLSIPSKAPAHWAVMGCSGMAQDTKTITLGIMMGWDGLGMGCEGVARLRPEAARLEDVEAG